MGVNTRYYTVYGVSIDYDNDLTDQLYETDLYAEFEDKKGDCAIITDGMSGEYIVIGKILFDSGDLRWGEIEDCWAEISTSSDVLENYKELAKAKFLEHFPDNGDVLQGAWKLITFLHAS